MTNVCDWPESSGCDPDRLTGSIPSCELFSKERRENNCPREYDRIEVSKEEVILDYKVEGDAKYRFIASIQVGNIIKYRYELTREHRIKAERQLCEFTIFGWCKPAACGEPLT